MSDAADHQVCITANRVYVQKSIADQFIEKFSAAMRDTLKLGRGLEKGTTLGPVTVPQTLERAERVVEDAVNRGAKLISGGKRPTHLGNGYYFEPTLLVGAPHAAAVAQEELFAPICSVALFETEEEVTKLVNDTDMGLTNYIASKDINKLWRALENWQAGSIGWNSANPTAAESPFGGIGQSGCVQQRRLC